MTNYGALAILAELREHDARSPRGQRRLRTVRTQSLLTALETFPAGADGWREVSAETLRESAELNRNAFDLGRRELTGAKLIEYQPGTHRGDKSRWRITFPVDEPPPKKVPPQSGDLPKVPKVPPHSGDLPKVPPQWWDSTTVEGAQTRPGKVRPTTVRGPSADFAPLTSQDAPAEVGPEMPTALEPSALEPLSARTRARDPRALLLGLDIDETLRDFIITWMNDRGVGDPFAYLLAIIGKHPHAEGGIRDFLERRRRDLDALDGYAEGAPAAAARPALAGRAARLAHAWDDRPGPGYGQCPECGRWVSVNLGGGRLVPHRLGGTERECPGSRRRPADAVPCTGCGNMTVALRTDGKCNTCRRNRRGAPSLPPGYAAGSP